MNIETKNKYFAILAMALLIMTILPALSSLEKSTVSAQTTGQTTGPLPQGVTPQVIINPRAFLSFSPTTIGVNQPVLVNTWTTPPPDADRLHENYQITITAPDKTQTVETINSEVADGTAWFTFTPTQTGTYQLQFNFLGTYFPAGRYSVGQYVTGTTGTLYTDSMYYNPTSTGEQNLTVQSAMVSSWQGSPIPTGYWVRPVPSDDRNWWPILGNYPWVNGNAHDYAGPYVISPTSAHVAWRLQGAVAGVVGAELGQLAIDASQVIGANSAGSPSVIYDGRAYMTYQQQGVGTVAACFDLRTGKVNYEIPTSQGGVTPTVLSYTESSSEGGSTNMGVGAELLSVGANLIKIDPWTGLVTTNVTAMSGTFYNNNYVLSVQTIGTGATAQYRLINWTTTGSSATFASRVMNNITWPWSSLGTVYDLNSGVSVMITTPSTTGGALTQQIAVAASIITGQILWNNTINGGSFSSSCCVADNGKVAILVDTGYYVAYDLQTGAQVWQSPTMSYPWDAPAFGAYDVGSAYGMIYRSAYSGIYAFNWNNGQIAWKFEAPTPYQFETPYTDANGTSVYSFNGGMLIANGMVYDANTEHSPTEPITRGWSLFAVNATTGADVWNITSYSGSRTFRGGAADGYLAFDDFYDGYMYVYGMGQSATTVTAPQTSVDSGAPVLIQGTVTDKSPATTTSSVYAPGQSVPCVSDASMSTWMEYLYMQAPIGGLYGNETITGVPVTLTAIGSDGTSYPIGTATTNGYYGTFACTWTPPKADTYTITATFAGDDSYGSSSAATALVISPQATTVTATPTTVTPTATQEPTQTAPDYTMTIIAMGIAVILAVAIATALLMIKKRP